MAPGAGIEPAIIRLTVGRCTTQLPRIKLVEKVGDDPTATILQGSSAPRCFPRMVARGGVEPPTRGFSDRRSTAELPRRVSIERKSSVKLSSMISWSGQGELNSRHSRWQRDTLPLSYVRVVGGEGRTRTCEGRNAIGFTDRTLCRSGHFLILVARAGFEPNVYCL